MLPEVWLFRRLPAPLSALCIAEFSPLFVRLSGDMHALFVGDVCRTAEEHVFAGIYKLCAYFVATSPPSLLLHAEI